MVFHENRQQTIRMKYHALFFSKLRKMLLNLSSDAVVIGALRVKLSKNNSKYLHKLLDM